ncbi:AAA family ATPase [Mucilaginibacter sp. CAU 1740]|uniref:AAA family ATPase n=1 Tax=Mucilaginibacter sp. CAU 1740 TaxID=3140365 RepID=UPI00325B226E
MNHTSEKPLVVQVIRQEGREFADKLARKGLYVKSDPEAVVELFDIYQANEWMAMETEHETPQMLFGNFWLEGELCILFADTNMGKSLLAVQLADSITRGERIAPFELGAEPSAVLYIDFELTGKQFEQRYTDGQNRYQFASWFYRGEYNQFNRATSHYNKQFDKYVIQALTRGIKRTDARVLIIDNITCLRNGTESAGAALLLMKELKKLKTRHGLSILVLAHTPKRNLRLPLSRNDLQGSKMLINFCDSAFAMGESHATPGLRYLKQIKQRSTAETYGADHICLAQLERHNGFLKFVFTGNDCEKNHLRDTSRQERERMRQDAKKLSDEGLSQRQVAERLGLSVGSVNRMLNNRV